MIESPENPLEGGLEIIAKPPGKKPGDEQEDQYGIQEQRIAGKIGLILF